MLWSPDVSPDVEPYKVLLKRGEFVDEARDGRAVPFKVYFPDEHGQEGLPLIVWSHGFGGNRDGASFISRFVASHGYIVLHLTHHGTDSSLWEGKEGHPWDILRKIKVPRETTLNRMKDVPFALDEFQKWAGEYPEIGDYVDFEAVGMSGHSFGALTTQVMAGQLLPNEDEELIQMYEPRFKSGILYSPVPIHYLVGDNASDEEVYRPISIPLLHMTGTDDDSPIEGYNYKHRLVIGQHAGHEQQPALILQDGDHMVYNGTRGKLDANPKRKRHEEIIKIASLAFWEAQLKNNKDAREWLANGGVSAYMGEDGTYQG